MRWKRKEKNLREATASYSAVHPDVALTTLYAKSRPPRWKLGGRDADDGIDGLPDDDDGEGTMRALLYRDDTGQRTPRETWRKWRAFGKSHGTEHPEQTADRIQRHRAAEDARMARIDASTAGRVQDRFDTRTAVNVARNASASRVLNSRHAEQPSPSSPAFDFRAESVSGGPYRSGRPSGQRAGHSGYAWRMEDGFIHTGF